MQNTSSIPAPQLARDLFCGQPVTKTKSLTTLVNHALQMGLDHNEMRSIAMEASHANLVEAVKQKIYFYPSKQLIQKSLIVCCTQSSYKAMKQSFSTLMEKITRLVDKYFKASELVLEASQQLHEMNYKAISFILVCNYQVSLCEPAFIAKRLTEYFPECSYQTQSIICEYLSLPCNYFHNRHIGNSILEEFLVCTLSQQKISLEILYDILENSSRFLDSNKIKELIFSIIEKYQNLFSNYASLSIISDYSMDRINNLLRNIFKLHLDEFYHVQELLYNHLSTSLTPEIRKEKCVILNNISHGLMTFYTRYHNNPSLREESQLALQALQQELQLDLTKKGTVCFQATKNFDFFQKQLLARASGFSEQKFVKEFSPYSCIIDQNSPPALTHALLGINCKEPYQVALGQHTLTMVKNLYDECNPRSKSLIRYQIIKFYARVCGMEKTTSDTCEALKNQIINDFELTDTECLPFCIQLLRRMAASYHWNLEPHVLFSNVKAILALAKSLDNTNKCLSILIDLILFNITQKQSIHRFILGFIAPILSYEYTPRVVRALQSNNYETIPELFFILNLPQLDNELKSYVVNTLFTKKIDITIDIIIPLLKPLIHHCKDDPQFYAKIDDFFNFLFARDNRTLSLLPGVDHTLLAFFGLIPSDFTIDDLFSMFLLHLDDEKKLQLKRDLTIKSFILELNRWENIDYRNKTLDDLPAYYHFYLSIYEKILEEIGFTNELQAKWQHHRQFINVFTPIPKNQKITLQKIA